MPRIYDADRNPLDFCQAHYPAAVRVFVPEADRAEYLIEGDAHPPYSGEEYRCEWSGDDLSRSRRSCGRLLTMEDDEPEPGR